MVKLNVLAADIHKRMVEDDRFGYSWAERYGAAAEEWTVDGIKVQIKVGDYDCSSSTITAWRLALAAAGVDLQGATYTGNCVITNYSESSNASDDATYTVDFRVTGAMTAAS